MKKMTFLFMMPLLCCTASALCKKDTITWAPKQQRVAEDQQRLVRQRRALLQQNNSRSPSPARQSRRIGQQSLRRNRVVSINQRG